VFKEGRKSPIFIGEPAFFFPTLSRLVYFNPKRFGGIFNFRKDDAPGMPLSDAFVKKLKPSSKPLRVFDGVAYTLRHLYKLKTGAQVIRLQRRKA